MAATPPPASTFFKKATITEMRLSPDGKTLLVRRRHDICVMAIEALDAGCARTIGNPSGKLRWAGSKLLIASNIGRVSFGALVFSFANFQVIDITTGTTRPLVPETAKLSVHGVLWVAPDGESAMISATARRQSRPGVYRLDLRSSALAEVEPPHPQIDSWYADANGTVRAGIAYVRRTIAIYVRDRAGEPLRQSALIKPKADETGESIVESLRFDGPGGTQLAVSNDRTGRFGVYKFDAKSGSLGDAIFEHATADADDLLIDPRGEGVIGITYEDDRQRVKWLRPSDQQLQMRLDRAFPNSSNRVVESSRDDKLALVATDGPDNPGMYYLLDRSTQKMGSLMATYQTRADLKLAPMQSIEYLARDNLRIPAYLTLPINRPAKALPLIVMPHGGPFARDHWGYDPFVQFLASRGYAVLQPQFRGSTGYGREFVERAYGQWGRAMQDDLLDGIAALAKKDIVDPTRVCIFGISYGGYAAMWAAARDTRHYRCAASLAGISDLKSMLRYDSRQFYAVRYAREWRQKVEGVEKADLASVSPLQQAASISIPLLIAHGERDTNVPPSQSRQLVKALTQRSAAVDAFFYKDEGHGLGKAENQTDFLNRLEAFLAKHNPAG